METETKNYQQILLQEFENRCKRNSAYSLRAFSRDIQIPVSSLSMVLAGKQGLSVTAAEKIADRMQLTVDEKKYFCALVQSKHSRSKARREEANTVLQSNEIQTTELSIEAFKVVADWHHFAILELTHLSTFQSKSEWIAAKIGITVPECKTAIARLQKLGLLEKVDGRWTKTKNFLATHNGVPSRSLKNYHHQILGKAAEAIDTQSVEQRDLGATIFAMNEEDMTWAREEILKFRKALTTRLAGSKNKTKLYALSTQLFSLTEKEN